MIFVVCTYLNPNSLMPMSNLEKSFTDMKDFNEFYKTAKTDPLTVINIMRYNPIDKPGLRDKYDIQLLNLSRENPS